MALETSLTRASDLTGLGPDASTADVLAELSSAYDTQKAIVENAKNEFLRKSGTKKLQQYDSLLQVVRLFAELDQLCQAFKATGKLNASLRVQLKAFKEKLEKLPSGNDRLLLEEQMGEIQETKVEAPPPPPVAKPVEVPPEVKIPEAPPPPTPQNQIPEAPVVAPDSKPEPLPIAPPKAPVEKERVLPPPIPRPKSVESLVSKGLEKPIEAPQPQAPQTPAPKPVPAPVVEEIPPELPPPLEIFTPVAEPKPDTPASTPPPPSASQPSGVPSAQPIPPPPPPQVTAPLAEAPRPPAPLGTKPSFLTLHLSHVFKGQVHQLRCTVGPEFWIGRDPKKAHFATRFLPETDQNIKRTNSISRLHCRLCAAPGELQLKDGSANSPSKAGTQMDGIPISKQLCLSVLLADQKPHELSAGPYVMRLHWLNNSSSADKISGALTVYPIPSYTPVPWNALWLLSEIGLSFPPEAPTPSAVPIDDKRVGLILGVEGNELWVSPAAANNDMKLDGKTLVPGKKASLAGASILQWGGRILRLALEGPLNYSE